MSTYRKRKKARKAREKEARKMCDKEDIAHGRFVKGRGGPEALYEMNIDLRTATYMMCIQIDKGSNEYITNISNNWSANDWLFLLVQMKEVGGLEQIMRFVLDNDDLLLDPGTLFPDGVG